MTNSLRAMLDKLEADLTAQISGLRKQLAPLERELADVRRAKAAIKESAFTVLVPSGYPSKVLATEPQSPYAHLTMKELALKALREQYPTGATSQQLMDTFVHAWGRTDIERSSLSPQLSRLKNEGKIDLRGRTWVIIDNSTENETPSEGQSEGVSDTDGDESPSIERKEARNLFPENWTPTYREKTDPEKGG